MRFSRVRSYLPAGLIVANVPVGGLDRSQAAQRLAEVYSTPVELRYNGARIQLDPSLIDFELEIENMLALANLERTQKQFWEDFWDYLWGRTTFPTQIPLAANYSQERLRAYLSDICTSATTNPRSRPCLSRAGQFSGRDTGPGAGCRWLGPADRSGAVLPGQPGC